MRTATRKFCSILVVTAGLLLGPGPAHSEDIVVSNFETDAGYVAGSSFSGVDGWSGGGGAEAVVTPAGYSFVIEGDQSSYVGSVFSYGTARKLFNTVGGAGVTASDVYELSWLQASPDALSATAEHGIYLVDASGSSPVGIFAKNTTGIATTSGSTIHLAGMNGAVDTGIPYISGGGGAPNLARIYRFIMRFDFSSFQVTGYYEDVTNDPGNRQLLGTAPFSSNVLPSAAVVASDFGPGLYNTSGYVGFDDIRLTPTPELPPDGSLTITNFESSAGYQAGQDIVGIDGWFSFSTSGAGVVMPDPVSGYNTILDGAQSFVMHTNNVSYGRPFGSASAALTEGSTLSWLLRFETDTPTGNTALYVSHDLTGGATPAGIQANYETNTFDLFGLGGSVSSGVTFAPNVSYKLEMELDFVNDRFEGFVTDVSNGGERQSLGTVYFATSMQSADAAANGGIVIAKAGGSAAYFDLITLKSTETPVEDGPRSGFGNAWVRSNAFPISGVPTQPGWDSTGGMTTYQAAGMTTAWIFGHQPYPYDEAVAAGLPMSVSLIAESLNTGATSFNQLKEAGGVSSWLIGDEPNRMQMENYRLLTDYVKTHDSAALTYVNVFPIYASNAQLWGDDSNPSYTYQQYLEDTMTIIKPDVLMYDYYPFPYGGGPVDYNGYFFNMTQVRSKALEHNVPYRFWMQSFETPSWTRLPSESDLRMQMFSHLAAGFTGASYWTYGPYNQERAFFDANDQPTPVYAAAAAAHPEAANLGNVLRFMTSTDVRFVPGLGGTATPTGLSNWAAGAGGDPHLQSVTVNGASASTHNGLVGVFQGDDGQMAFMIVNLHQGATLSAAQAALTFTLQFDSNVGRLLMVNRETGEQELVSLNNNTLQVTLPGGTGNLYKYVTHLLNYTAGPGGSLDGSTLQTAPDGGSGSPVTAVPEAGAQFGSWSDSATANPRTDANVTADLTVTANFETSRGVPIEWYTSHGLSPASGQTWADVDESDSDGDGIPDWEEYMANTDPTDPSSSLEITDIGVSSSVVVHFWPSSPDRRYTLQVSDDMGGWTNVTGQGPRPGTGAADSMTDAAPPQPNAFYRIVVDNL